MGIKFERPSNRWRLQRDVASGQFDQSLYAFAGDENSVLTPQQVMESFDEADRAIARLEEIQQRYNQTVRVQVQKETTTLALAVKLVGGAGRREKMWRSAASPKRDRYSFRDEVRSRNKDTEYANRTITQEDCVDFSRAAARYASALRNAIARGNNSDVDIEAIGLEESEATTLFRED